jgi:putative hydrolase of the HAD superfamily
VFPRPAFARVWEAGFDERCTGELGASVRSACRALGVAAHPAAVERVVALRTSLFRSSFEPRPDTVPTLERLRVCPVKVGLITDSTSEVPPLWEESDLSKLFDVVVFSCTERIKKPDPRIYKLACARLGVEASACLYVGDGGSNELAGAEAVGMRAVLLRPGDTEPSDWTGEAVTTLAEIVRLVDT